MSRERSLTNALPAPAIATDDSSAVEILRVWASPGKPQQLVINPVWSDPAAWGVMLVDIARHAAAAYAQHGGNRDTVLNRIRQAFDAEWTSPTDA